MKNSTYFRMFIAMALIVFISFSLLGGLSTALSYRRTMEEKQNMMISALSETARYVATRHISYGMSPDDLDISIPLTMTSRITGFDILLTNTEGLIEACSDISYVNSGRYIPQDVLREFDSDERAVVMSTLGHLYATKRLTVGMPLEMSTGGEMRLYGYLFITDDIQVSRQGWQSFSSAFIMLAISVMSLAFVISFIASKKQAEPINEMASAARRFARGEFDVRVTENPDRNDEIEQLTKAFNYMAESMENHELMRRDFIANLSHELKTPMTVIAGFAEGLLDGTIPRKDEARYLGIISSETRRLSRLVRSMLDISMLGETSAETIRGNSFDISEVIRLALLSLSSKIDDKKLDVDALLPESPVITYGHKDSITQVVYNLIDNAIKYSYPKSIIRIELHQQDQRAYISVLNHGETIPAEELPYIFQRFHKADKSRSVDREGVGLGLYIVKAILDKHNEDIFVTSSGGETKFIFTLTIAQ